MKKLQRTYIRKYKSASNNCARQGEIAEQILKIAKEHEVRIIKDIETASILSVVEIGECIPIETYEIIAITSI